MQLPAPQSLGFQYHGGASLLGRRITVKFEFRPSYTVPLKSIFACQTGVEKMTLLLASRPFLNCWRTRRARKPLICNPSSLLIAYSNWDSPEHVLLIYKKKFQLCAVFFFPLQKFPSQFKLVKEVKRHFSVVIVVLSLKMKVLWKKKRKKANFALLSLVLQPGQNTTHCKKHSSPYISKIQGSACCVGKCSWGLRVWICGMPLEVERWWGSLLATAVAAPRWSMTWGWAGNSSERGAATSRRSRTLAVPASTWIPKVSPPVCLLQKNYT